MKPLRKILPLALLGILAAVHLRAATDGNRLTYLDSDDPFYPHRDFPKLTTPQWVGEPGVEAAVILSIDDMRDPARYEAFLRPILERLKRIDGRAPVSIMVNAVTPTNAQLQAWLKEGLSLEVHTLAHPCPCLQKGDFAAAANTYHGCVELMNQIPGNKPVAFRMPCCDSMNSLSPRFLAEIFNRPNSAGQFLTIDSSVFCLLTTNDPALPRALVMDPDGREKFRKYFPAETKAITKVSLKNYAGYIEDYPYPYVVGKLCWQFPCMVPSDWEAFNLHGSTNPVTLADWKSALDAVVLKQGVFTFVFHPHGWSSPAQFVEFIDYAVAKHGKKVKFLTFREAQERLNKNFLLGNPLRAADAGDNAVRILDVDNDGYMDAIVGRREAEPFTRLWNPAKGEWHDFRFPFWFSEPAMPAGSSRAFALKFGVFSPDLSASLLVVSDIGDSHTQQVWSFAGTNWERRTEFFNQGGVRGPALFASTKWGSGGYFLLRDLDRDGRCEILSNLAGQNEIHQWSESEQRWKKFSYALPRGTFIARADGGESGLRFIDVNRDGYDDVLFSNEERFSLHLFIPKANPRLMWEVGWNDQVWAGKRGEAAFDIPPIVRAGTNRNNGVWFKNGAMWIQNEDTAHLPDKVRKITFRELLTADQPPPLPPDKAQAAFRPRPGFKVELAAAEPLVLDPIAFEWGADGRLWVVDMFDYPLGRVEPGERPPARRPHGEEILTPPGGGHYVPSGRIKALEDTDGDGRYDKATTFLDELNFPTGVLPWRNGVLVAAAPEIFYAEDTDGDGKADKRTTLFTGFTEGNQQHRLNGFDYGLDGWVYGANGDSGGTIRSALRPDTPPVNLRSHDFRFRPDTGEFETVAGGTQYGRHRDDWGNWFGNNNPAWLWHYHIPEHYLARNPHLAVKSTKTMLAQDGGKVFRVSRARQRFNDHHHSNHVTAANSPMPYRDDLFGPEFATSVFISDPVHNVVHREVLQPDGVTFTSHRAPDEATSEFLASTDLWFRPTMLKTGPDGALYIADMYRLVIEHPEWIPKWIQTRLDLRAGSDMGRIWRVFPEGATLQSIPNLAKLDTAGLVAALDSPNGWQRDTAQRLLVERKDGSAVEGLKRLCVEAGSARVRVQALCTLGGLRALTPEVLSKALSDAHAAVREHAVRLSEPLLSGMPAGEADTPPAVLELYRALERLIDDPSPRVRGQLALTLGERKGVQAAKALARLAVKDFADPHRQIAVMSSAVPHVGEMLALAFDEGRVAELPTELLPQLVALATALNEEQAVARALRRVPLPGDDDAELSRGFAVFSAFLDALDRRATSLAQFRKASGSEVKEALARLEMLFPAARTAVLDFSASEATRVAAVRLLARSATEREDDLKRLGQLLGAQNSAAIQKAALDSLARQKDGAAADALLGGWKGHSPTLRTEVLNVLLGRVDWCRALLAAVQNGVIPAGQIGTAFQQKLVNHSDRAVRQLAAELFTLASKDRSALLQRYAGVPKLAGNATRGMAIFHQQCATCHKLRGEGSDVGPDLAAVAGKDFQALLVAILDPNQTVEGRYVNYTALTKDEREVSGIISAETANSITLRATGGKDETLLRTELKEFSSSGVSLMPEGLETALTPQDMADLLAAVRGN